MIIKSIFAVIFCSYIGNYNIKIGEITATKINGIDENVWTIEIINNDIYFGTDFGAYVLKNGEINPEQINEVIGRISLITTANNGLYLAGENNMIYFLKNNEVNIIELDSIYRKRYKKKIFW